MVHLLSSLHHRVLFFNFKGEIFLISGQLTFPEESLNCLQDSIVVNIRGMRVKQGSHMILHALRQRRDGADVRVVPTLKDAHKSTLGAPVSDLLQILGQPLIVKFVDLGLTTAVQVISFMGVEAGRDKNKIGLESQNPRENFSLKGPSNLLT